MKKLILAILAMSLLTPVCYAESIQDMISRMEKDIAAEQGISVEQVRQNGQKVVARGQSLGLIPKPELVQKEQPQVIVNPAPVYFNTINVETPTFGTITDWQGHQQYIYLH